MTCRVTIHSSYGGKQFHDKKKAPLIGRYDYESKMKANFSYKTVVPPWKLSWSTWGRIGEWWYGSIVVWSDGLWCAIWKDRTISAGREKKTPSIARETSRTEFGQQMRSGELPAYLSLNRLLNGILSYSWCYFVQIRPISQKFNLCVTDRRTDGPTDRPTDGHTLL